MTADTPHPPFLVPDYKITRLRAPRQPLIDLPAGPGELTGPRIGPSLVSNAELDMTKQSTGEPIGQRIVLAGQVRDAGGRPVRRSLIELWQCNAAGRYLHDVDQHDAPLDPHFTGVGRLLTDEHGCYRFITIKPGSYPFNNHYNAWRPSHIHFSLFGDCYAQRFVTQMYFPGDPLLAHDPIYGSVPAEARDRLVSTFDLSLTLEGIALGFRFDLVLDGRDATPFSA
jgi:protocatechuate 3,4-dioxygenase beta subunit